MSPAVAEPATVRRGVEADSSAAERGGISPIGWWQALARQELLRVSAAAEEESAGLPGTSAEGRLIRPLVALAGGAGADPLPEGFWSGALAIQLAHEASLVHDDIVDEAAERRGTPTMVAEHGIARALLRGDHLLTAAYRAAAATGSLEFATLFARAVERTVAGEAMQGAASGRRLAADEYRTIALGKAGELIGCALALAPLLEGRRDATELFELGRRIGLLYQMLDDLLDYCPATETGKPALGDFATGRWTWVLEECPEAGFGLCPEEILERLHAAAPGGSAMARCLVRLETEAGRLAAAVGRHLPGEPVLRIMLAQWIALGRTAVQGDARSAAASAGAEILRARLPAVGAAHGYLAEHSRSFRFASRFFPAPDAERVARVYSFCRLTDDLVDRPASGVSRAALLDQWIAFSRRAYDGVATGLPLLDRVMGEMAAANVPFDYAAELVEGMRMDLRGERYADMAELRRYTYRVASVVGLWTTRLFGVHDPAMLARAERMGHAMQLTNILRDVGEDWRRGRLYLPAETMARFGVGEPDLAAMADGAPIAPAYAALLEELLRTAEADYAAAVAALPALPAALARPVAVAAHVYRGIHGGIRRNGYDNFRRRAYTSPLAKGWLAARALWTLERARRSREMEAPLSGVEMVEGGVE